MSFKIDLPLFQGPFDLLLFFIERDELDIYDIPISKITDDFLSYIRHLEEMNIEVASEFILVAATLMSIKAKLLLPRPEVDEEGNEIDPREELVQHLIEYKKYKSVIDTFKELEHNRLSMERRGNIENELKQWSEASNIEAELQNVDTFKLLKSFQKVLQRFEDEQNRPVHQVVKYPYTIEGQKDLVLRRVLSQEKIKFEDFLKEMQDKVELVFSFLAILELLQAQLIKITLGKGFNNFMLQKI